MAHPVWWQMMVMLLKEGRAEEALEYWRQLVCVNGLNEMRITPETYNLAIKCAAWAGNVDEMEAVIDMMEVSALSYVLLFFSSTRWCPDLMRFLLFSGFFPAPSVWTRRCWAHQQRRRRGRLRCEHFPKAVVVTPGCKSWAGRRVECFSPQFPLGDCWVH